jgi:hypothetical protein
MRLRRTTDSKSGEADVGYGTLGRLEGVARDPSTRSPSQVTPRRDRLQGLRRALLPLAVLAGLGTVGGAACAR